MDKNSLMIRRLDNLDASVSYFGKRLLRARKRSASLAPDHPDVSLVTLEIRLLDDVISYLKLC